MKVHVNITDMRCEKRINIVYNAQKWNDKNSIYAKDAKIN